ncbi:MAG: adenylate/guanylate cyclase domain-containing protein [Cyanobacteriota bacterium]|nr:adenylate/guanylate cyclase domain-containing protein [Cyanobacteriota bacterium]
MNRQLQSPQKKRKRSIWTSLLETSRLSTIVAGFWAFSGAIATGLDVFPVQWLDWQTQTLFFRLRGPVSPPEEIIIVAIDDPSLAAAQKYLTPTPSSNPDAVRDAATMKLIESWPWQRTVYGIAIERLVGAGAKVVALDILFDLPSGHGESDDLRLAKVVQRRASQVVLASMYSLNDAPQGVSFERFDPIETLAQTGAPLGLVNFPSLEADGRVRRLGQVYSEQVLQPFGHEALPSLAEATLQAAGANYPPPKGEGIFFYGEGGTFETIPFWQLLASDWWENYQRSETFKDKIVLIGVTSLADFSDDRPTPFDPEMPGVEIHANAIATLLNDRAIARVFPQLQWRGLFVAIAVGAIAFGLRWVQKPTRRLFYGLGFAVLWLTCAYTFFTLAQVVFPAMVPAIAIALVGFSDFAIGAVKDHLDKSRLRHTLERYVAEPVVKEILKQPDDFYSMLQGHRLKVAILFSDIRGFTTLSLKMQPEELMVQLNTYFHAMVEAIVGSSGTLDKFIGDAVMAEFGFPVSQGAKEDALNAVRAALTMRRELDQLRKQWRIEGRIPFFNGIGINYGEVVAGDIGSWRRREYAVLGDAVNVASRVESVTKNFETDILITDSVYQWVKDEVEVIDLGEHPLKGREDSLVRLYSLIGFKGEQTQLYDRVKHELEDYLAKDKKIV